MKEDPGSRYEWAALRAGRVEAFEHLIKVQWTPLVAYVARHIGDTDTAEDIVQDVLRRFWERRKSWVPQASPEAVLFRMARNAAIDLFRHNRRRENVHLQIASDTPTHTPPADGTQDLEQAIRNAIGSLPVSRREVFLLVRMTSLTYVEIAELLELKPQTVANHMSLALADLRKALGPFLDQTD